MLYIGGHVQHFDGMTDEESEPLIDFLKKHSTRPEFTCRFRWESGTLAFWDNRCTQHFAINDYPAETRIMRRITVCGERRSDGGEQRAGVAPAPIDSRRRPARRFALAYQMHEYGAVRLFPRCTIRRVSRQRRPTSLRICLRRWWHTRR